MTFLASLRVTGVLCIFRLVLEEKVGKETSQFVEKSANNFAFSDAEDNTWLDRRGIPDLLLLGTLLAIYQTWQEPSFWEVADFFY